MPISKSVVYTGTLENDDIKEIRIYRTTDEEGNGVLSASVNVKVNGSVKLITGQLTASMKSDIISWLPTIRNYIKNQLGI